MIVVKKQTASFQPYLINEGNNGDEGNWIINMVNSPFSVEHLSETNCPAVTGTFSTGAVWLQRATT